MTAPDTFIAIIGAGPAGLMAAERIAQHGHRVIIYDAMPSPARKFLMAGRGGLNLTHSEPLEIFLTRYRPLPTSLENALRTFNPSQLRTWADGLGAETFIGSSGRVFPKAMKASPLLRAWLRRLNGLGVILKTDHRLMDIATDGALVFQHAGDHPVTVRPIATVLALGGASWPRLGSTGAWRDILLRREIPVTPFQASNMGFLARWTSHFSDRFAGTPLKNITVTHAGQRIAGEVIITRDGMEGGAIYALSPRLREAIAYNGAANILIDLKPALTAEALMQKFSAGAKKKETQSHFLQRVAGLSPAAINLLRESTGNALPKKFDALAQLIKAVPVSFHAAQGLERAISSSGGISFEAFDDNFMLRQMAGVFAAGEMLDWEAPTGGYLLQACFATAVAAAEGVCNYLAMKE